MPLSHCPITDVLVLAEGQELKAKGRFSKVNPYPPPPGVGIFVPNKTLVPFDRTVTERSKLFFSVVLGLN